MLGARHLIVLISAVLMAACDTGGISTSGRYAPAAPPAGPVGSPMQGVSQVLSTAERVGNLPLTLYVGADYCPFCASMRWPLVRALSRFGSFSGLGQRQSTSGIDGFPSIATYDFNHATFSSPYVTLAMVETADPSGNTLQQTDAEQASLINRFDPGGGIPFVFVGGRYVARLPYSPSLLEGKTFQQIQQSIDSTNPDRLGQAIDDEADVITALICSSDGMQPASVCNASQIRQLTHQIPTAP